MIKIVTDYAGKEFWQTGQIDMENVTDCMHVINIHPDVQYQRFHGFGGAFTEASAHVYAGMSQEKKRR